MIVNSNIRPSTSDYCLSYLTKYIYENNLKDGDRLPSATELCKMIGVSLTTLRESLKILEGQGKVEVLNGKGCFIILPETDVMSVNFTIERTNFKQQMIEMLEVRKMLESQLIACIVRNCSKLELVKIQHCVTEMLEMQVQNLSTTPADRRFHATMIDACHNTILKNYILSANALYEQMWNTSSDLGFLYDDTIVMHAQMFEFIKAKDLKNAIAVNDKTLDLILLRVMEL